LQLRQRQQENRVAHGVELIEAARRVAGDFPVERRRLVEDDREEIAEIELIGPRELRRLTELLRQLGRVVPRELPLIERLDEQLPRSLPRPRPASCPCQTSLLLAAA